MADIRAALREIAERRAKDLESHKDCPLVDGEDIGDETCELALQYHFACAYLDLTAPLLVTCGECGGTGKLSNVVDASSYRQTPYSTKCPACHGTGTVERADLAAIRQRAESATPGPWTLDKNFQCFIWGPNMQMIADNGQDEDGTLTRMRGVGANLPLKDNGEFIAHARTDIPAMLDLIAAQAREIAELKGKANGTL